MTSFSPAAKDRISRLLPFLEMDVLPYVNEIRMHRRAISAQLAGILAATFPLLAEFTFSNASFLAANLQPVAIPCATSTTVTSIFIL